MTDSIFPLMFPKQHGPDQKREGQLKTNPNQYIVLWDIVGPSPGGFRGAYIVLTPIVGGKREKVQEFGLMQEVAQDYAAALNLGRHERLRR